MKDGLKHLVLRDHIAPVGLAKSLNGVLKDKAWLGVGSQVTHLREYVIVMSEQSRAGK